MSEQKPPDPIAPFIPRAVEIYKRAMLEHHRLIMEASKTLDFEHSQECRKQMKRAIREEFQRCVWRGMPFYDKLYRGAPPKR